MNTINSRKIEEEIDSGRMEINKEIIKIELDRIGRTYSAMFGGFLGFFLFILLAVMLGKVHLIVLFLNSIGTMLCLSLTYWLFKYKYYL